MGPEGYACKDPATVTSDDFVYTGYRFGEVRLCSGGVIPAHSHRTSEVLIVAKGTIIAGFIDTNNTAYYKKLEVSDVMMFPQAMLHFQVNVGKTPALAFVSLNGANPGLQITSSSLFEGNLPGEIAEQISLLSHQEVTRMKKLFGTT
uniref:Germin-like protein n=1 Tax=Chenopodium quinoa TaxID=63459 RepID=A0A803N5D4_CHEQI